MTRSPRQNTQVAGPTAAGRHLLGRREAASFLEACRQAGVTCREARMTCREGRIACRQAGLICGESGMTCRERADIYYEKREGARDYM